MRLGVFILALVAASLAWGDGSHGLSPEERVVALKSMSGTQGSRRQMAEGITYDAPNAGVAGAQGAGSGSGSGSGSPSGSGNQSPTGSGQGQGQGGQGQGQQGQNPFAQMNADFNKNIADGTKGLQNLQQPPDNSLKDFENAANALNSNSDSPKTDNPYVSQIIDTIAQINNLQKQYYQVLTAVFSPAIRTANAVQNQIANNSQQNNQRFNNNRFGRVSGNPISQAMGAKAKEGDPVAALGKPGSPLPNQYANAGTSLGAYNPPTNY